MHMAGLKKSVPYNKLVDKEPFSVNVNLPLLQVFTDATFGNDLRRQQSKTSIIFTYCGGAIVFIQRLRL